MRNDDVKGADSGNNSDTKESIIGAPVQNNKKSGSFNLDPTSEVASEITCEDSVSVHNDQTATEEGEDHKGEGEGHEHSVLESKPSWVGSKLRRASQYIKRIALPAKILSSRSMTPSKRYDQMKSVADALKGLKFITTTSSEEGNDWNAVEKRFEKLTTSDGLLHYSNFGECIGMKNESKEFASELFRALARKYKTSSGDQISDINKAQLKEFWDQISDESFDSRLRTFFDMIDKDADGRITKKEVEEVHNLETLLLEAPNQSVRKENRQNPVQSLSQDLEPTQESNPLRRWYQKIKYFLMDNWQRIWIVMLWFGIVSGLFVYKYLQYRNKAAYGVMGYCLCIAKGGAETLKFNMALILLPVCRNTITWLRNKTKLGLAVPLDDNLNFHKVIAAGIAIGVILHGGAHLTCDFPRLIQASEEEYEPMKPYFGEEQPENYWWFVKGVEGVTGIIMVVLMAIAFTFATPWFRRSLLKVPKPFKRFTGYNTFWYSHHLFVIVYALLVVHGLYLYLTKIWYQKSTWMYLAVPVLLYACERLIRAFRSRFKPVKILKAVVYPENVLALHMSKPFGRFKYKSGQYIFVKCTTISPFQWHPFSITSAPGDSELSVHIRILGDWTRQLNSVFSKVCQPALSGRSGVRIAEGTNDPAFPKISIDGPYGAPAQEYKNYDVVLLVGLGIGATTMISIIKDIINNMETEDNSLESDLENGTANKNNNKKPLFKTRKAYMYWVTREQKSFEWFKRDNERNG